MTPDQDAPRVQGPLQGSDDRLHSVGRADIASFVQPVAVIGRLPDGSGLSRHLLALHHTLGQAVEFVTYEVNDTEAVQSLAWDWPRYAAVIATESIAQDPHVVLLLRRLAGSIPRILVLAWDSDELDPLEASAINQSFDCVLAVSEDLAREWSKQVAPHVNWLTFPFGLDLRAHAVGRRPRHRFAGSPIIVGSVAAFHPRKHHRLLIDIVADLVDEGENLELVIHSNLQHSDGYATIAAYAEQRLGSRAVVTNDNKTQTDMLALYRTLDVFVSLSQGESFNIPVREALAAGVPCLITSIPGHEDLLGRPGVESVEAKIPVPASYPERGGVIAGLQYQCVPSEAKQALKALTRRVRVGLGPDPAEVAQTGLDSDYRHRAHPMFCALMEAGAIRLGPISHQAGVDDTVDEPPLATDGQAARPNRSGWKPHTASPTRPRRLVLLGHDAGFFSLYNTYASHVAWWQGSQWGAFDEVLADWSVRAVTRGTGRHVFESFCYAREEDGNLFFQLFENPFPDQPYSADTDFDKLPHTSFLTESFNAKLDPYLTYKHAAKLYRSLDFPQWRRRMNRAVQQALRPRAHLLDIVDELRSRVPTNAPALSLHVRHPSHAIEQADRTIATPLDYVRATLGWLAHEPEGYILLATDQDRVVDLFKREFGRRVVVREGVARTTAADDEQFEALDERARMTVGHQVQHLSAREPDRWNSTFAEDVVIDALFLATGDVLLHSTSNVATAISMQNPDMGMMFIRGGDTWNAIRARKFLEDRTQVV